MTDQQHVQHQAQQPVQQVQQYAAPQQQLPPAGWYPDTLTGHMRWWDGQAWQMYAPQQPVQQVQVQHPRYANRMPVGYQRQQTGHSLTVWLFLSLLVVGIPWLFYYSVSPNHYWHL